MTGSKLLRILALPLLLCTGCKKDQESAPSRDWADLVQSYVQASNAREIDKLKSFYIEGVSAEYVDHVPAARIKGRDELVDGNFQESWKAFPDSYFEPLRVLARDKEIVLISLATGTNTGPLLGLPPTEQSIGILSAYHWQLDDDGRIVSETVYMDQSALPGQLGMDTETPFRPAMERSSSQVKVEIATNSTTERDNVEVIKKQLQAMSRRDADAVLGFYTDSAVYSFVPAPGDLRTPAEMKKWLTEYFAMSSNLEVTPEWIWGAGDYVAARTVTSGTNDGPLADEEEATQQPFRVTEMQVYRLVNGEITRHWTFGNSLGLISQLGLVLDE